MINNLRLNNNKKNKLNNKKINEYNKIEQKINTITNNEMKMNKINFKLKIINSIINNM